MSDCRMSLFKFTLEKKPPLPAVRSNKVGFVGQVGQKQGHDDVDKCGHFGKNVPGYLVPDLVHNLHT